MKLLSLHLENYRRYRRLDIEFPDGVIAIVGTNGSGKSTMVESIAWALYGNKPEIVRAGRDSIKWTGAPKGDGVKAILRFQLEEQEYELERTLKNAVLSVEGKMLANGLKPVEEKIVETLSMEYKEFFASIYARQKELNLLSQQRPEERRKLIHRLLGITSVEDARGLARRDRRRLEERVSGATSMLYKDGKSQLQSLKEEKRELEEKLKEFTFGIQESDKCLKDIRASMVSIEKELESIEQARTAVQKLQKDIVAKESGLSLQTKRIQRIERDIKRLDEKSGEEVALAKKEKDFLRMQEKRDEFEETRSAWEKLRSAKEEMEKLVAQEEEAKKALESLKDPGDRNALEKRKEEAEKKDTSVETEIREILAKRSRLEQELDHAQKELSEGQKHLDEIKELGGEGACPTCERPLEGHYEMLEQKYLSAQKELNFKTEELGEEISSFSSAITSKQKLREALQKKRGRFEKDINELASISKERELLEKDVGRAGKRKCILEKELDDTEKVEYDPKEHEAIRSNLRELAKDHNRYVRLKEALERLPGLVKEKKELEKEVGDLNEQLKTIGKELKKAGFDEDKYNKLKQERRTCSQEERKLSDKISTLKTEKASSGTMLAAKTSRITELEGSEAKMAEWNEDIRYLHRLAGARPTDPAVFSDFLAELTNRIRPVLRSHSTELFNMITENRYGGLELDEDYSIAIYDASSEPLPISRFSGGEEDVANLCLRIAVSRALSERSGALVDYVILDEIFGSQDLKRRENILQALDSLSGVFRQVFVISHVESVKDHVSYIIRVEEVDDGSSTAIVE